MAKDHYVAETYSTKTYLVLSRIVTNFNHRQIRLKVNLLGYYVAIPPFLSHVCKVIEFNGLRGDMHSWTEKQYAKS